MTSSLPQQRFNPWPYAIGGFFAVAITAAVVWVAFCIAHRSDLVAADYYEQEVTYQEQIDRIHRARTVVGDAAIQYVQDNAHVRIQLPQTHARAGLDGVIRLYRPSEAGLDRSLPLRVDAEGRQYLDTEGLKGGLWEVRVRWRHEEEEYFLSEKVIIVPKVS